MYIRFGVRPRAGGGLSSQGTARFTLKDLARFDGKEGRSAYTAFEGKVYDVTGSNLWLGGRHSDRHSAGENLSEQMINAPHDESVLTRFPVVGELVEEKLSGRFVSTLQAMHPHPIVVHFSEVCPILAAFFVFLYLFVERLRIYEVFSSYLIILGFISSVGCMATGFFSWSTTYERTLTRIFRRKIIFSALGFSVMIALYAMRTVDVDVLTKSQPLSYVYGALVFVLVPITFVLGHYGGKIVYG